MATNGKFSILMLEALEQWTAEEVATSFVKWISEDDAEEFCRIHDITSEEDEEKNDGIITIVCEKCKKELHTTNTYSAVICPNCRKMNVVEV